MPPGHEAVVFAGYPTNLFVAAFIGSPAMNLFEAELAEDATRIKLGSQELEVPNAARLTRPKLREYAGKRVVVGIRPEHLSPLEDDHDGAAIEARVDLVEALGSELLVHFQIDAQRVKPEGVADDEAAEIEAGGVEVRGEGVAWIDPRVIVKVGDAIRLLVDTDRLQ
jgi:multiple sugar transport system ATP-binding protein